LLALLVARRFEFLRLSRALPIAMAGVYLAIALFLTPFLARFFPSCNLARDSRPNLKPEMEFGALEFTEPSLVWYFRNKVRGFMTPLKRKDASEFMSRGGSRFIVLPTASVAEIFPNVDTSWRSYRERGFNIPKGRRVDLTILLKPISHPERKLRDRVEVILRVSHRDPSAFARDDRMVAMNCCFADFRVAVRDCRRDHVSSWPLGARAADAGDDRCWRCRLRGFYSAFELRQTSRSRAAD